MVDSQIRRNKTIAHFFLPHLLAQVKKNSTFAADSFKPNFKFIQL